MKEYLKFVRSVTSEPSKTSAAFTDRMHGLAYYSDINIPMLLTAAIGLPAEAGEFTEIVKKIVFQGKEITPETKVHMKKELGDLMFYFALACMALEVTPEDIVDLNMEKLKARYPNGFEVSRSENRAAGDI